MTKCLKMVIINDLGRGQNSAQNAANTQGLHETFQMSFLIVSHNSESKNARFVAIKKGLYEK